MHAGKTGRSSGWKSASARSTPQRGYSSLVPFATLPTANASRMRTTPAGATILVVDDYPTNRELLVTLLAYQRHRLLEASNGAEALTLVRAHRPDLVITD